MEHSANDSGPSGTAPPYFPFQFLLDLLSRMEAQGIPERVDPEYLSPMPSGTIAPMRTGLRSLGLIDGEGRPLSALVGLVEAGEERPGRMAELIRDRFPWATTLAEGDATPEDLENAFRERGPTGSTLRKAMAFYLAASSYAGISINPHFGGARRRGAPATRRSGRFEAAQRTVTRRRATSSSRDDELTWMRRQYFELLRKKAEEWGQPHDDILDRIERLIGVLEREDAQDAGPGAYVPSR